VFIPVRWHADCSITIGGAGMPLNLLITLAVVLVLAYIVNYVRIPLPTMGKTLANIVLALVFVGIILWLINTYVPMAGSIKGILNIVVVIGCCVGVLQALNLWTPFVAWWRRVTTRISHSGDQTSAPGPSHP
jgi:hypothetical protein